MRWASNQRTLQQLNQHRLSDEEEHFWFLWAAAFINHPQKKHHPTTTWVEDPLFCCSLEWSWEKLGWGKGGKKQILLFSNQSNQLWSTSVSRSFRFQMNQDIYMLWFDCCVQIPMQYSKREDFPLQDQLWTHYLRPSDYLLSWDKLP